MELCPSLYSDEYILESYKVNLNKNNQIFININFSLDTNNYAKPVPMYLCLEDKNQKDTKLA